MDDTVVILKSSTFWILLIIGTFVSEVILIRGIPFAVKKIFKSIEDVNIRSRKNKRKFLEILNEIHRNPNLFSYYFNFSLFQRFSVFLFSLSGFILMIWGVTPEILFAAISLRFDQIPELAGEINLARIFFGFFISMMVMPSGLSVITDAVILERIKTVLFGDTRNVDIGDEELDKINLDKLDETDLTDLLIGSDQEK